MSRRSIWEVLGIEATDDLALVRKGYARRLKLVHPEDDAEGFQELREAYELAQRHVYFQRYEAARAADEALAEAGVEPEPPAVEPPPAPGTPVVTTRAAELMAGEPLTEEDRFNALFQAYVDRMNADLAEVQSMLTETPVPIIRLKARFEAVLVSPALDNFAIAADFEPWIEQMLIAHLPASDPLISVAIEHFRWVALEDAPYRRVGDMALARDRDLRVLSQLRRRSHSQHAAFKALTLAPTRWRTLRWRATAGLEEEVMGLLSGIRTERPGLIHNLNPEAIAWWEGAVEKPRIGLAAFLGLLGLPMALLLGTQSAQAMAWWPAALVASVALGAIYFYGIVRPRFARRAGAPQAEPAWKTYGWVGAGLLLPAAGAAIMQSGIDLLVGAAVIAVLSLAAAGWARVMGEPAFPEPTHLRSGLVALHRTGRGLLRFACLLLFWLALATFEGGERWVLMLLAGMGSALVFLTGGGSLQSLAAKVPAKAYTRALLPIAVILVVLAGLVAALSRQAWLAPWLAAFVGVLALVDIVSDPSLSETERTLRAWLSAPVLFVAFILNVMIHPEDGGMVGIYGAWMLLLVATSLVLVYRRQTGRIVSALI